MKVIVNENKTVFNIIHSNGIQTSVKVSPSGHFDTNELDRTKPVLFDKRKYTVIVSSSHGCQMSCSFCHLTQKQKSYRAMTVDDIIRNVLEAVEYVGTQVDISERYIKLCYMGEGEAILQMKKTVESAKVIISKVIEKGLAKGVDGVDISTMMPKDVVNLKRQLVNLNNYITESGVELNPYNYLDKGRSVVRLFYSLHHFNQAKRDLIIPRAVSIKEAIEALKLIQESGINVVTHYMFMKGVNDSDSNIMDLVEFVNDEPLFKETEFRILRMNATNVTFESLEMDAIITHLKLMLNVKKFKVQFSAGEDIKAACGMFI